MKLHLLQELVRRRFSGLTRGKVHRRVGTNLQLLRNLRCPKGALLTMTRTSPCVLHFSMESASSKGPQESVVHVVITSATKKDVIVQSLITFAHTQTDYRRRQRQFHMDHLPSLFNFLQGRELFRRQLYKQGCVLLVLTMKWYNRLHQSLLWI